MKSIALGLLLGFMASQVSAAEGQWLTDLGKAQEKAKAEKKMVFVDFTGSDWCPPCQALHKNILTSEEFINYAKDNLVLVEVDFPRRKAQATELKKANEALAKKYHVESFPTVIVFDSQGKELKRDDKGYDSSVKAKEYVARLKNLQKT